MTARFELLIRREDGNNIVCRGYVEELIEERLAIEGTPRIVMKGILDHHAFEPTTYAASSYLSDEEIDKLKAIRDREHVWGAIFEEEIAERSVSVTFEEAMLIMKGVDIDVDPEIPDLPPLPPFAKRENDLIGKEDWKYMPQGSILGVDVARKIGIVNASGS